jgi:hypothetical protein
MSQEPFDRAEFIPKAEDLLTGKRLNKSLMDSLPYPAMLIGKDRRVITVNKIAKAIGVEVGSFCWETFGKKASITKENRDYYKKNNAVPLSGIKCTFCKANEALASQESVNEKIQADDIIYDTFWVPLTGDVYLHYAIALS